MCIRDRFLRAANAGMTFGKVPAPLLKWHDHSSRLTRSNERYTDDAFMKCRRQHLLDGPLANTDRVRLWGGGQTGKAWLKWFRSINFDLPFCVDVHPRRIGNRIHDTPIISPDDLPVANAETRSSPLVIAVGTDGTRDEIRAFIEARGYEVGTDAWFVA